MISGLDLEATVDYTLKDDKDNPTVWKLGIIPGVLFGKIAKELTEDEIATVYKMLQVSLKGWENYSKPYETAKEKIFGREMDVVPLRLVETIPVSAVNELAFKVMEINQLTENERKN